MNYRFKVYRDKSNPDTDCIEIFIGENVVSSSIYYRHPLETRTNSAQILDYIKHCLAPEYGPCTELVSYLKRGSTTHIKSALGDSYKLTHHPGNPLDSDFMVEHVRSGETATANTVEKYSAMGAWENDREVPNEIVLGIESWRENIEKGGQS